MPEFVEVLPDTVQYIHPMPGCRVIEAGEMLGTLPIIEVMQAFGNGKLLDVKRCGTWLKICVTTLPAIVCDCGRYVIETPAPRRKR